MTEEEFNSIIPGQTIVEANLESGAKELLVKFYIYIYNSRETVLCCTEDITNPFPFIMEDEDYLIHINNDVKIKRTMERKYNRLLNPEYYPLSFWKIKI